MATKTRGAPYPLGSDPNDAAGWLNSLAQWVDDRPGVAALTTTARNALTGVDRWDGKLVLDTTLDRLFRWDAGTTTWIQIADASEIQALLATSGTPAANAVTASRGVATFAARSDHVHPTPAWQNWTPTSPGGLTMGNATVEGRYFQHGKFVTFWGRIIAGTTTVQTGVMLMNLPVTAAVAYNYTHLSAHVFDSGSLDYDCIARLSNVAFASIYSRGGANGSLGATTPWTISTGDHIELRGTYEAA